MVNVSCDLDKTTDGLDETPCEMSEKTLFCSRVSVFVQLGAKVSFADVGGEDIKEGSDSFLVSTDAWKRRGLNKSLVCRYRAVLSAEACDARDV